ncbi:hypothetical protein LY76DRAFT_637228 [Colletotrichum caudatum]|nr:hypothetical protein LY76DRAFT_637228 [Colletotrichum caudatum]
MAEDNPGWREIVWLSSKGPLLRPRYALTPPRRSRVLLAKSAIHEDTLSGPVATSMRRTGWLSRHAAVADGPDTCDCIRSLSQVLAYSLQRACRLGAEEVTALQRAADPLSGWSPTTPPTPWLTSPPNRKAQALRHRTCIYIDLGICICVVVLMRLLASSAFLTYLVVVYGGLSRSGIIVSRRLGQEQSLYPTISDRKGTSVPSRASVPIDEAN